MEKDIHFTDKQGNEYFVMVRETKVEVWRNKEQIHDVRFYEEELTEVPVKTQGEFVNDGSDYQVFDYVLSTFNTDEGFTAIEVRDYDDNLVYEIFGIEMIDEDSEIEDILDFESTVKTLLIGEGLL